MSEERDDSAWLKFPERCGAAVGRLGEIEECGKPAVAVTIYDGEEFEPHAYPVCKHHARGRTMMPLYEIIGISSRLSARLP